PELPHADEDNALEKFIEKYPRAKAFIRKIVDAAADGESPSADKLERAYISILENNANETENKLKSGDFLFEKASEDPTVSEKIVNAYLRRVSGSKPTAVFGGGNAFVMPPRRPETLKEAADLAAQYLNEKGEIKW
ncbi:MAG: hypothetical protein J5903_03315, partial [Clostridia bacterium]|nr:hypothetical protein [Clostridia bacterium]